MRSRTELHHSTQIMLFLRCEPVEAYAKETFIECGYGFGRSCSDVFKRNGAHLCKVPGMFTPFLKKIRVASGLLDDFIGRFRNVVNPLFTCRLDDR